MADGVIVEHANISVIHVAGLDSAFVATGDTAAAALEAMQKHLRQQQGKTPRCTGGEPHVADAAHFSWAGLAALQAARGQVPVPALVESGAARSGRLLRRLRQHRAPEAS